MTEGEFETVDEDDDYGYDTGMKEIYNDTRDPKWIPEGRSHIDLLNQETHSYNLRPRSRIQHIQE